jgi:hypothetical protein
MFIMTIIMIFNITETLIYDKVNFSKQRLPLIVATKDKNNINHQL